MNAEIRVDTARNAQIGIEVRKNIMSNRPPSEKQRRVAKKIIENITLDEPKTGGEILEEVGYGPGMVKNPGKIVESEGVYKALAEQGFTVDNAKGVVAEILLNKSSKDADRLKAAENVFKIHGSFAPEKSMNLNLVVDATKSQDLIEMAKQMSKQIKEANINS
jgi:hypothetical protein